MMKYTAILIAAMALCMACKGPKHEEPQASCGQLTQYEAFHSEYVGERTIRVWTPTGYTTDSLYSVIYMHDGQMLYDALFAWNGQEWGVDEIVDSLISSGRIQPCIVVGIDNAGTDRIAEYCPDDAAEYLPEGETLYGDKLTPMGNRYVRFLAEELKPFIDSTYSVRTDAAHTMMIGSSCGGLITSYAFCKRPDLFGSVACLSTHCTFMLPPLGKPRPASTEAYIRYIRTHLPEPGDHKLYMDCGGKTLDRAYVDILPALADTIRQLGWNDAHFRYRSFPEAAHTETDWQARLPEILEYLAPAEQVHGRRPNSECTPCGLMHARWAN